jgi:hypothetical protein
MLECHRLRGLLLCVVRCPVHVSLSLVDALPELVARFCGRSLHRCFRLRGALLEIVERC